MSLILTNVSGFEFVDQIVVDWVDSVRMFVTMLLFIIEVFLNILLIPVLQCLLHVYSPPPPSHHVTGVSLFVAPYVFLWFQGLVAIYHHRASHIEEEEEEIRK